MKEEHGKDKGKKLAMLGVLLLVVGVMRYLSFDWSYVFMTVGILMILKALMMKK